MNDLVVMQGNIPMVSSQLVAEKFNKVHTKLMRDVENLHCSDEFKVANFASFSFTNKMNRTFDGYMMTEGGFAFLCMGFTGKKAGEWKEKYINAFEAMKNQVFNLDHKMNELSTEAKEIKEAGRLWSKNGQEINKAKKKNKILCNELINEVQGELFPEDKPEFKTIITSKAVLEGKL
ncbi:Rha family transcriptional regulator [bacterium]|nr:Rha family transcriptional regulator [bacterium]